MNESDINKKIAEFFGWKYTEAPAGGAIVNGWWSPGVGYVSSCPDYYNDANAMIKAEHDLYAKHKKYHTRYIKNLAAEISGDRDTYVQTCLLVSAEPPIRATAFVKTIS